MFIFKFELAKHMISHEFYDDENTYNIIKYSSQDEKSFSELAVCKHEESVV